MVAVSRFLQVDPIADAHSQLVVAMANQCARLFELAGSSVAFPFRPADVAPMGDTAKMGVLTAAVELRTALNQFADGRQALRDLGFEPVFQNIGGLV